MQKSFNKSNILIKVTIVLTLLLMTISSAAAGWNIPDSITLGSGSDNRGVFVSTTIPITNTDNSTNITSITPVFTKGIANYLDSDFNITITGTTQLSPNNSTSLTVQGYLPLRFNAGQRQIGTITINGVSNGATLTKIVAVNMQAKNNLEIGKVTATIDDAEERVSSGETLDVKRKDSITLAIPVENLFSSSSDININDIEITIDNNNLDIDESETVGDLGPRDDDEVTITFDIADDADDGKETVVITATGTDDNNAEYTSTFRFYVDVQVERYDLSISDIRIPTSGVCQGSIANLNIEIDNSGVRDLDEAMIYVTSKEFDFNKKITKIVIDEGDQKTITVQIPIASNMAPGTYFIDVESFYQESTSAKRDEEQAMLTVKKCDALTTTTTPSTPSQNTGQNTNNQPSQSSGFEVVTPTSPSTGVVMGVPVQKKSTISDSTIYLALLIIACLVILILIVVLITRGKGYY